MRRPTRPSMRSILGGAFLGLLSICVSPASAASASEYFVHSLPGAPGGPLLKMHAGHLEVDPPHHGNLFFWHFQNRHIGDRQRTVIWLNGGPGCSSMDGALMEIGPYRVREGGKLEYNPGSWDEFANLLFVDNPVGTGFSYVDTDSYVHELDEMAAEFMTFLERWFEVFPEYEHDDIYIAGESYAGQHIPYIANAIKTRNAASSRPWNVKGLLIGNGWISGSDQYPAYLQYALKKGLIQSGSDAAKKLEAQQAICDSKLAEGGTNHVDTPECELILQQILRLTLDMNAPQDERCINMYDIRLRDSYSSCGMNWPPDLVHVTPYLRRADVVSALHVGPDKVTGWSECSGSVSANFRAWTSLPAVKLLPGLLESGIPITLFSGAEDLICNHVGTEELINNMVWSGGKGFEISPNTWAPRQDWTFEGEAAGIYQEARNLTYILFYNSSHMVPFDYPRRTRDMLDRFMGVDIGSIGGKPIDSKIDGNTAGPQTSVGGHPNSTIAAEQEAEKLQEAKWAAYYRSGEVALVVVIIAAAAWFWYVYSERVKMKGYQGIWQGPNVVMDGVRDMVSGAGRLGSFAFQGGKKGKRDLEAADFDEAELESLDDDEEDDGGPTATPSRKGKAGQSNGSGSRAKHEMEGLVSSDEEDEDDGDVGRLKR